MDIWHWIRNLPRSESWPESDSKTVLELAVSKDGNPTKSILLIAERTFGSNTEALGTFSVSLHGFFPQANPHKTLWLSDPCPLFAPDAYLPLLLQLIHEVIACAPTAHDSIIRITDPDPMLNSLASFLPDQISGFFNLVFLSRLFWLCVYDAPAEAGALFFETIFPRFNAVPVCDAVMTAFLTSIGADGEVLFMRAVGYMLAKWFILRDLGAVSTDHPSAGFSFSYARESHGLWTLKGYDPVPAMNRTVFNGQNDLYGLLEAKESVLRYALAHQLLEAVFQLEYSIRCHERYLQVCVRLDNLRIHVTRLGFGPRDDDGDEAYAAERHFPSRVRLTVGPGAGSAFVAGLTLGRSTGNPEREMETQRLLKGSFGKSKLPQVKATAKRGSTARMRSWRWDHDADGNMAIFEGVLCDNATGVEVATWRPGIGGKPDPPTGFRKRYSGASRLFSKMGGLIFAGDLYGEEVSWRLGKEEAMKMRMDGRDLKWRLGGKVWLSYWPNEVKASYFETRCVDWCEEVVLPLDLPH